MVTKEFGYLKSTQKYLESNFLTDKCLKPQKNRPKGGQEMRMYNDGSVNLWT